MPNTHHRTRGHHGNDEAQYVWLDDDTYTYSEGTDLMAVVSDLDDRLLALEYPDPIYDFYDSNVEMDFEFDADTADLAEMRNVMGTLIHILKVRRIIR